MFADPLFIPQTKWIEDKSTFGYYEGLPTPESGLNRPVPCMKFQQQQQQQQQEITNTLMQEFESYLGNFEVSYQSNASYNNTLTPPQSPPEKPANDAQLLQCYPAEMSAEIVNYGCPAQEQLAMVPGSKQDPVPVQWGLEMSADVNAYHKYEPTNQIVVDPYGRSEFQYPLSPCNSSNASCSSIEEPDIFDQMLRNERNVNVSNCPEVKTKNKLKMYARPSTEDRKYRKKEQNKNAATRYRQKKKQEITEILTEEQELTIHNDALQVKVTDLQREISYLKNLMRDLFRAKGMIQ